MPTSAQLSPLDELTIRKDIKKCSQKKYRCLYFYNLFFLEKQNLQFM
jgi:hypothetical protein